MQVADNSEWSGLHDLLLGSVNCLWYIMVYWGILHFLSLSLWCVTVFDTRLDYSAHCSKLFATNTLKFAPSGRRGILPQWISCDAFGYSVLLPVFFLSLASIPQQTNGGSSEKSCAEANPGFFHRWCCRARSVSWYRSCDPWRCNCTCLACFFPVQSWDGHADLPIHVFFFSDGIPYVWYLWHLCFHYFHHTKDCELGRTAQRPRSWRLQQIPASHKPSTGEVSWCSNGVHQLHWCGRPLSALQPFCQVLCFMDHSWSIGR